MRVELPDGRIVQAHGLGGFISVEDDETPGWALYLDHQWRERRSDWPSRFVDWPDHGLPADEEDAFQAVVGTWNRIQRGELVDVACDGGTGRTGTVLACLAVLCGLSPVEAVEWVRSHYNEYAIEAEGHERLVDRFAGWSAKSAPTA